MEPSAGIIDAQSVRAAASVPAASRGYGGGKKVPGRKRHVITAEHPRRLLDQPPSLRQALGLRPHTPTFAGVGSSPSTTTLSLSRTGC